MKTTLEQAIKEIRESKKIKDEGCRSLAIEKIHQAMEWIRRGSK